MEQYNNIKKIKEMKTSVQPKTRKELISIIELAIKENGNEADLNFIDTSKITDMYRMFAETPLMVIFTNITFKGDISKWDVSKVKGMTDMFGKSPLKNKPEFHPTFK